jgi:WD40 repeat protein
VHVSQQHDLSNQAFHPKHRAIATCGTDYCVKIWPLPPLPDPYPNEPLTPKGYRPKVIHFPLFSTARMFENFVDSIQWSVTTSLFSTPETCSLFGIG